MIETLLKILSALSPIVVGLGAAYINYINKKRELIHNEKIKEIDQKADEREKNLNEKQERILKIVIDRLQEVEISLCRVEESIAKHLNDTDFRQEYRNRLRQTAMRVLENSYMLKQSYKNMLSYWTDSIERFGLNYYYSERRKEGKHSLEKFLTQEKNILIDDFNVYIDGNISTVKTFNGKKVLFSDFVIANGIHNKLEFVIMKLVINGLKEKDVIDLFTTYIESFFELFITATITWDGLKNVTYNEDAA
jgi:hypothetical protein